MDYLGSSNNNETILERLLSDKLNIIKFQIDELKGLIAERTNLEEIIKNEIAMEVTGIKNRILQVESITPFYKQFDLGDLSKEVTRLKELKLKQRGESWRDTIPLRREVLALLVELYKMKSKMNTLG